MKNYKIKIGNNPELRDLMAKKADELGLKWSCLDFEYFCLDQKGEEVEISIPDFFKLKPEKKVKRIKLQGYIDEDRGVLFFTNSDTALFPESKKITYLKFNKDGTIEAECEK